MLYAVVNHNTSGAGNTIIDAPGARKRIVVHGYVIIADAAVTMTWMSGTQALSGPMSLAANGGVSAPEAGAGHFAVETNKPLNVTLGGAVRISGHIAYSIQPTTDGPS